ncbi:MAG: hypothetical protein ACJ8F7_07940 [Gemmataceae bacterium]
MNPWLVTWEPMGAREAKLIRNRIAAILPNRTAERDIFRILELLYTNHSACSGLSEDVYVAEQVRFAKRTFPYKAQRHFFPEITCGHNPFLFARPVFDLKVEEDAEGFQALRWEQPIYPYGISVDNWDEEIKRRLPFKRKRMKYCTRTNTIVQEGLE